MRLVLVLAMAAALAGCAPSGPSRLDVTLASMVGQSEAQVVRQWGVPDQTFDVGGEHFIVYRSIRQSVIPGGGPWGPPWWGWGGSQVVTNVCDITFEIEQGKVKTYSYRGACG